MRSMVEGFLGCKNPLHRLRRSPSPATAGEDVKVSILRLPAVFMRGGTSKAVIFRQEDLPADWDEWEPIFLSVMGSPDPHGGQLDGLGGGLSSLSKICVVSSASRPDADVDFAFAPLP